VKVMEFCSKGNRHGTCEYRNLKVEIDMPEGHTKRCYTFLFLFLSRHGALNDRCIKTCVDKFTSVVYACYEFLSVVRHTRTILPEQLDDVDDTDVDFSEIYDVEEVMAVATINEASPTSERTEYI